MRALLLALTLATPLAAQDFSENSEASSWNLAFETPARFEAEVVDVLCHLTGDCPEDCGGGARQLGLLRSADGVLVFPNKNGQPLFTGAARELAPFCGQTVEVDGLMIEDDYVGEFHYGRSPLPPLKALDGSGRVVYIGTFSKALFPAIRLGYAVVPSALVASCSVRMPPAR